MPVGGFKCLAGCTSCVHSSMVGGRNEAAHVRSVQTQHFSLQCEVGWVLRYGTSGDGDQARLAASTHHGALLSPTNCPVILSCPRLAAVATCNVACSFPETLGILQFLSTVTNIHRKAWLLAHTQEACSWHTQEAPAAPNIREAEAGGSL